MRNKKGLSDVVTTLIIVLLVLAAIGIIWNPIKSLLTGSTDKFDQTKCLEFGLTAKTVKYYADVNTNYRVTLQRSAGGGSELIGAKVLLFAGDSAIDVQTTPNDLGPLGVKGYDINGTGLVSADKIQVTPYYISEDTGEEVICSTSTEFKFSPQQF